MGQEIYLNILMCFCYSNLSIKKVLINEWSIHKERKKGTLKKDKKEEEEELIK